MTWTPPFTDFATADTWLGDKREAYVTNNTGVRRIGDDVIAVRLHGTEIIVYTRESSFVTLRAEGWVTSLTARRMNDLTPDCIKVRRKQVDGGEATFVVTDASGHEYVWDGDGLFFAYTTNFLI